MIIDLDLAVYCGPPRIGIAEVVRADHAPIDTGVTP
ncbi:hypothetical protein SAMN05421505_1263 [Sinosporangium album]|uniref:Uncharacterized protein n=1 Tax=Sinosporangium album TaxID=504805 RepID=A0A1G8G732_9ACTN|nr:hypothetical protein SAMN05421505_1263 [Sinosporangium album]